MNEEIPDYIIRKRQRDREYGAKHRKRILASPGYKASQKRRRDADPGYYKGASSISKATKLGRLCDCCTRDQFIDVYRAAVTLKRLVPVDWEVDHILAYSLGGMHCCKNLSILSRSAHKNKTREDMIKLRKNRC